MNYLSFRNAFLDFPTISRQDIRKRFPDFDPRRLVEWQQKGYISKIRNGFYVLTEHKKQDLIWIANRIYSPSYISLQTALSYYNLIPEYAAHYTSITTQKGADFHWQRHQFSYRHIKPSLFFGIRLVGTHRIAYPDKALLDMVWLNCKRNEVHDYLDGLRLNMDTWASLVSPDQLHTHLKLFGQSTKITQAAKWIEQNQYQ
jgi:hypothetical protein